MKSPAREQKATPDQTLRPTACRFIGRLIAIDIDRPLGSVHPRFGFVYPLNYGYLPGEIAPDGECLDAYILGVFEPLARFTGQCIAVIHRHGDQDDKLVVVPDGRRYSDDQILALTEFQERFFKVEVLR
jgi:inorganic pyrophosphatase